MVAAALALAIWRYAERHERAAGIAAAVGAPLFAVLLLFEVRPGMDMVAAGYWFFGITIAVLAMLGRRRRDDAGAVLMLLAVAGVVIGGFLDLPLDSINSIDNRIRGKPFYSSSETAMNAGLYAGLTWLRHHAPVNTVIAVEKQKELVDRVEIPGYFDYAAFGERRVFLGGWLYSSRTWEIGGAAVAHGRAVPFPDRLRLNNAVFVHADKNALRTLVRRYGVRYLLDDRQQGQASTRLRSLGRLVYSNPSVAIYAVGPSEETR